MNQDDFHESSVMVVLAGNFMLETQDFSSISFFLELFYQLLRIVEFDFHL